MTAPTPLTSNFAQLEQHDEQLLRLGFARRALLPRRPEHLPSQASPARRAARPARRGQCWRVRVRRRGSVRADSPATGPGHSPARDRPALRGGAARGQCRQPRHGRRPPNRAGRPQDHLAAGRLVSSHLQRCRLQVRPLHSAEGARGDESDRSAGRAGSAAEVTGGVSGGPPGDRAAARARRGPSSRQAQDEQSFWEQLATEAEAAKSRAGGSSSPPSRRAASAQPRAAVVGFIAASNQAAAGAPARRSGDP